MISKSDNLSVKPRKKEKMEDYIGHRSRLRHRFMNSGADGFLDYELLELLLMISCPRKDVKPLAKELLRKFNTLARIFSLNIGELIDVKGVGEHTAITIKLVQAIYSRINRAKVINQPIINCWRDVLEYCQNEMSNLQYEQFRLIFLDVKNRVITDVVKQTGTVDQAPIYIREVVKHALEVGASALIMVHNHPSGDPTPSPNDIEVTNQISEVLSKINIKLHDHIIVANHEFCSLKALGYI